MNLFVFKRTFLLQNAMGFKRWKEVKINYKTEKNMTTSRKLFISFKKSKFVMPKVFVNKLKIYLTENAIT